MDTEPAPVARVAFPSRPTPTPPAEDPPPLPPPTGKEQWGGGGGGFALLTALSGHTSTSAIDRTRSIYGRKVKFDFSLKKIVTMMSTCVLTHGCFVVLVTDPALAPRAPLYSRPPPAPPSEDWPHAPRAGKQRIFFNLSLSADEIIARKKKRLLS